MSFQSKERSSKELELSQRRSTELEVTERDSKELEFTDLDLKKSNQRLAKLVSMSFSSNFEDSTKSDISGPKRTVQSRKVSSSTKSFTSTLRTLNEIPSVDNDIKRTKLFLQKQGVQNLSVWSHLTNVLNKIISEQPHNVIDYFEEYSRKIKEEQFVNVDTLKDVYVPLPHLESAKNQMSLLNSFGNKEDAEEPAAGEEEEAKEPQIQMDLEEAAFYFQEAGIAIPCVQLFNINVAMKKMTEEKSFAKSRFWGKIIGTKQDYFVMECELSDEEYQRRIEMDELEEEAEAEDLAEEAKAGEEEQQQEEQQQEEQAQEEQQGEEVEGEGPTHTDEGESKASLTSKEKASLKSGEKDIVSAEKDGEAQEGEGGAEEEPEDPLLPPLPPPKRLLTYKVPPILKPVPKETLKIPAEKHGEGLNKKVYYVCNAPELEWFELPKVTPEEINVSQKIKVYFTGDLESKLVTYPSFPGDERNYLRAQIARITAATQVSPIGFYKFPGGGGDEEEEEEVPEEEEEGGGNQKTVEENKKFQPIPIKDLIDPSFASWVHHSRYILKQGRADWWSSKKAGAGEEEAEEEQEEEEDEEKEGGEEKETGPPLLTPLSEDTLIEGLPPWTARKTRSYNQNLSGAVIKSNLWPGASAIAVGKKCENVYCGWGHKHNPNGFSPESLPHPEYEYDLGPEVLEIQDPTVEVEQAWREAHKKKPPPAEGEEEGEEGEEEEEEEEDDD